MSEEKAEKWEPAIMDDRDPRLHGSLVGTILGVKPAEEPTPAKHPVVVPGYENPMDLAKALCGLDYEALGEYVMCIHNQLVNDASDDLTRGRTQLAGTLQKTANTMRSAYIQISNAAAICKSKN